MECVLDIPRNLLCFVVANVVDDNDDIVAFVVVLSHKPSINSLVKIGSVIDEMLLLLFLLMMLLLFCVVGGGGGACGLKSFGVYS